MLEIEDEVTFHTKADWVELFTKTNGDKVFIRKLQLDQGQAASLAWLVNHKDHTELEFNIKVKEV